MSQSKVSNEHDRDYHVHTGERGDVSRLLAPSISCWEAWRWELTRVALQRSSTTPTLSASQVIHPQNRQEG
jgi:hypothetical protein